ncbi:hypothetical protein [Mitsuaria sp. GD03876]|uniref:hypothetical protein n=1 Tax=Mitsuaria sp. GD03876 TaxID=2975399 RepID=UPI00244CA1A9|nr:hypothetical protein [Mitsuaria sp. GD03876]MDH0865002.1 hypothetical protein [Mitsuaria sp. GD03876]
MVVVAILSFTRDANHDRVAVQLARNAAATAPAHSSSVSIAPAASAPASGMPTRALPGSWPIDPDRSRLSDLLEGAANSADDYDRWVAMRISALCVSLPDRPVSDESVAVSVSGSEARKRAVATAARAAHERLQRFCASGDGQDYLAGVRSKRFQLGAIGPNSRTTTSGSPSERLQWLPVVLASPQRYAASAELWIEEIASRSLPVELRGNADATAFVVEELSTRLLGGTSAASVTALSRCAVQLRCAGLSGLNPEQQLAAQAAVDRIEDDVRHQRWEALSAH